VDTQGTTYKWVVKLDDGTASSCGSLQSAADMVRDALKTQHAAEIWWRQNGRAWELYERFEPDAEPDRGRPVPGSKWQPDHKDSADQSGGRIQAKQNICSKAECIEDECGTCLGLGRVPACRIHDGATEKPCPACGGTGRVSVKAVVKRS
jgi:hypothetical protein